MLDPGAPIASSAKRGVRSGWKGPGGVGTGLLSSLAPQVERVERSPVGAYTSRSMATRTRTVHVSRDAYERLVHEAERRGVAPDALADELVKADLAPVQFDLEQTLADLAEVRSRLRTGGMDAVEVVRAGRDELEQRGL